MEDFKDFIKKWHNINSDAIKSFQKNAYRVLLTKARQGMIICIPKGDEKAHINFLGLSEKFIKSEKEKLSISNTS